MESACQHRVFFGCSGFNSLQTGRYMESKRNVIRRDQLGQVSIPFKREGTWKVSKMNTMGRDITSEFQFPSNGKVHGK